MAAHKGVKREKVQPDAEGYYPEGRHNRVVVGERKTARSKRTLYLTLRLVEALRTHRVRQSEERIKLGTAWSDFWVDLPNTTGTPYDPDNFRHEFGRLCAKAGIGHWSPHELRHSGASLMLAQGTQLHVVLVMRGG